ncbi:uncharacterized protein BcabD6B2_20360 [Babesia caballi]|uniref:C3H1-type domain-containing protein n=1 Tax=Babesia caballi TaxID=5871 RepID=A0AAV4LRZ8_BABCB|nr:hypothetical protein, conserved [Babesia caballi]
MASGRGKSLTHCPSNLKQAIDWILRVTGKDGGGGDNTSDVAKAVQTLFHDALRSVDSLLDRSHKNGVELNNLRERLEKAVEWVGENASGFATDGPISRFSDDLAIFMGYENSRVSFLEKDEWKLTGAGILPASVAKHRVCNAVLNFVIRFLEGLSKVNEGLYKQHVPKVIEKLRKCVGSGRVPKGFETLVGKIEEQVREIDKKKIKGDGGRTDGKLEGVFTALKSIVTEKFQTEHQKHNVTQETTSVTSFLEVVKGALQSDNNEDFAQYCEKVKELFQKIKSKMPSLKDDPPIERSLHGISNVITGAVASDLDNAIVSIRNRVSPTTYANATLLTALRSGVTFVIDELDSSPYVPYYDSNSATWPQRANDTKTCAKIFLSCVPVIFSNLSYLYWRCSPNGIGDWNTLQLDGGDLSNFMQYRGFNLSFVNNSLRGFDIVDIARNSFSDFSEGMNAAQKTAKQRASKENIAKMNISAGAYISDSKPTYPEFINALRQTSGNLHGQSNRTNCPLATLYYCATSYFRFQQIKNAQEDTKTPSTIREMLYYLAALPFSLSFEELDEYITEYFKKLSGDSDAEYDAELVLRVTDSGSLSYNETISAEHFKYYLTATACIFAPGLLNYLQGSGASSSSEPYLHHLFDNGMNFNYPSSGSELFAMLADYTYALQFQLCFLMQQCESNHSDGCGWRDCKFGKTLYPQDSKNTKVSSHFCSGYKCDNDQDCEHDGNSGSKKCDHDKDGRGKNCGLRDGSPSALQAFLCDQIPTLRHDSGISEHMKAHSPSSICHVPMGFTANDLREDAERGSNLYYALKEVCGTYDKPLRRLCESIICITQRIPMTLSDLFGFVWQLVEGWEKDVVKSVKNAIEELPECAITPFGFDNKISKNLAEALNAMKGPNHVPLKHIADFKSIANCDGWNTCGKYFLPLTHPFGAIFAPSFAATYLSWLLYLTENLHVWFNHFLRDFNALNCKSCKHGCGNRGHSNIHGFPACRCPSAVQCADNLPLLWAYGFTFNSAKSLNSSRSQRKCNQFATQLAKVLENKRDTPLWKLIVSIDRFLNAVRSPFQHTIYTLWLLTFTILIYAFFFRLDLLHLQSHVHLPSSHGIPPVAPLTTGKAPALTTLTYYMP